MKRILQLVTVLLALVAAAQVVFAGNASSKEREKSSGSTNHSQPGI